MDKIKDKLQQFWAELSLHSSKYVAALFLIGGFVIENPALLLEIATWLIEREWAQATVAGAFSLGGYSLWRRARFAPQPDVKLTTAGRVVKVDG